MHLHVRNKKYETGVGNSYRFYISINNIVFQIVFNN
jgi:hypothetical protein